jgi:hypothetical protein
MIDQELDRELEAVRDRLRDEQANLPPNGERLASIVFDLLKQCQSAGVAGDLVEVQRLPPPRPGAQPTYHLQVQTQVNGSAQTTGVLVLTVPNAVSATGFLRRLREDARPLDRVLLVTDARVGLVLGEKGREYLAELEAQSVPELLRMELSFAEVIELEALHTVFGRARSGDVEIEVRPGRPRRVSEDEVLASNARRGRYLASRLLREMVGASVVPLEG